MPRLLSIGEAMLEISLDEASLYSIGGDTFNCAVAAGKAGLTVDYLSRIGQDFFAEIFETAFEVREIQFYGEKAKNEQNGIYFIRFDSSGERHFQYYRSNSAASRMSKDLLKKYWKKNEDILYASGISQAISPNASEMVQSAFKQARARNVLTAYDLNYRSKLWSEAEASQALKLMMESIEVLFASGEEKQILERAWGSKLRSDEDFLKLPQEVVVMREGGRAGRAYFPRSKLVQDIPVYPVKVKDTTGAGDVFNGYFLAEFLKQEDLYHCLSFASAAAALQCSRSGGARAVPELQEVRELVSLN